MTTAAKNILFGLCALPLLAKVPYILSTWETSPLESGAFVIWLSVVPAVILSEYVRRRKKIDFGPGRFKGAVLAMLLACLAAWLFLAFKINCAGILLGLAILAPACDLRFGRAVAVSQIPAFFIAVLATPSLSYWIDYYLDIGLSGAFYFTVKFAFAQLFLLLWCSIVVLAGRYPRLQDIAFALAAVAVFLYGRVQEQSMPDGDPLFIDTAKVTSGDWIAVREAPGAGDKRFFSGCDKIERINYFRSGTHIGLLALEIKDIANIHPVGICLKSSGREVLSSRQIQIPIGEKTLQINEFLVRKNGETSAVYSWFSNGEISTGDFAEFRLSKLKAGDFWRHYQIATPAEDDASAVENIKNFIESFAR